MVAKPRFLVVRGLAAFCRDAATPWFMVPLRVQQCWAEVYTKVQDW